jgi:hypothetical protein
LRNLFFFIELDKDSTDTDLNLNFESKEFYKRFIKNAVPIAEKLKIGDSVDKNLIFLNFLSDKYLRAADMSIILKYNGFAVNLNNFAISDDSRREKKPYQNFNERIPLSSFSFEQKDIANINN